jgi:hypothetical protein
MSDERPNNQTLHDEVTDLCRRMRAAQEYIGDGDHAGPGDILARVLRERDSRLREWEARWSKLRQWASAPSLSHVFAKMVDLEEGINSGPPVSATKRT